MGKYLELEQRVSSLTGKVYQSQMPVKKWENCNHKISLLLTYIKSTPSIVRKKIRFARNLMGTLEKLVVDNPDQMIPVMGRVYRFSQEAYRNAQHTNERARAKLRERFKHNFDNIILQLVQEKQEVRYNKLVQAMNRCETLSDKVNNRALLSEFCGAVYRKTNKEVWAGRQYMHSKMAADGYGNFNKRLQVRMWMNAAEACEELAHKTGKLIWLQKAFGYNKMRLEYFSKNERRNAKRSRIHAQKNVRRIAGIISEFK